MLNKYKVWMTQGQGCGEFPDAVFDTLEEALDEAKEMFGEGSVGIELPDGSWHKFGEEWNMPASLTLLRMRKGKLNPKQQWLMDTWIMDIPKSTISYLQTGGHTFQKVYGILLESMKKRAAVELFHDSLVWGLFDIFECPVGMMLTDEQIDYLINKE